MGPVLVFRAIFRYLFFPGRFSPWHVFPCTFFFMAIFLKTIFSPSPCHFSAVNFLLWNFSPINFFPKIFSPEIFYPHLKFGCQMSWKNYLEKKSGIYRILMKPKKLCIENFDLVLMKPIPFSEKGYSTLKNVWLCEWTVNILNI